MQVSIFVFEVLLLAIAIYFPNSWVCWTALQFSALPLLLTGLKRSGRSLSSAQVLPIILSSCLLAIGYWVGLPADDSLLHQAGIVFLCVGVGGLTGWFPVTAIPRRIESHHAFHELIGLRLVPVCIAAIFILRTVEEFFSNEQDLALLAVISIFSLAGCGIRLLSSLSIEQRIHYSVLTVLSNANIATVLYGWEQQNPAHAWAQTSNIPTSSQLFIAILVIESTGILLMTVSMLKLLDRTKDRHAESRFVEKLVASRWLSKFFFAGNFIVAGFPALPGSLWRFILLAALLLPHHRSNVTGLAETDEAFISLAIIYLLTTILVMLGQLQVIKLYFQQHAANVESTDAVHASS